MTEKECVKIGQLFFSSITEEEICGNNERCTLTKEHEMNFNGN